MPRHELLHLLASLNGLLFFLALGAIIGSFINVLTHRIPAGQGVVKPPSACPHCGTRLAWHDNIPILAWLYLRGRCRYCKSPISPRYPLVELAVALLFATPWVLWFMDTNTAEHIGITDQLRQTIAPEWTHSFGRSRLAEVWPVFLVVLVMLGSLAAATAVDAVTFTIPLAICWTMVLAGVVGHPIAAAYAHPIGWSPFDAAIPTVTGPWLCAALCGAIGVGLANVLLFFGLFPRSFGDFDQWESDARRAYEAAVQRGEIDPKTDDAHETGQPPLRALIVRTVFLTGPAVAGMYLGFALGQRLGLKAEGAALGAAAGLVVGVILRNLAVRGEADADTAPTPAAADGPGVWLEYPHARREMAKELLFLAPIVGLFALGFWLGAPGGPLGAWFNGELGADGSVVGGPAVWLRVLGGSLMGLLVGGGLVWAVRIIGTVAFGKEAMGLGDVHLMAGVGACLGWIDPVLAFFVAPFFGIGWAVLSVFASKAFRMSGAALPFGPHLALGSVVVVLGKPAFEWGLGLILNEPVNLP